MSTAANFTNLVIAYESIQSSSGLLTPAIEQDTISGICYEHLSKISLSLLDGSFR